MSPGEKVNCLIKLAEAFKFRLGWFVHIGLCCFIMEVIACESCFAFNIFPAYGTKICPMRPLIHEQLSSANEDHNYARNGHYFFWKVPRIWERFIIAFVASILGPFLVCWGTEIACNTRSGRRVGNWISWSGICLYFCGLLLWWLTIFPATWGWIL